jgi:hypothetical protein
MASRNNRKWAGLRIASERGQCSPCKILSLALSGKIRHVVPPDSPNRLFSLDDIDSLVSQRRELLNA